MSNEHHHESESGKFLSGFVVGAIFGAAVALLLGTKKGKKILKILREEGLEAMSGLEDLFEEEETQEEIHVEKSKKETKPEEPTVTEQTHAEIPVEDMLQTDGVPEDIIIEEPSPGFIIKPKRLFKGIPRKN